MSATSTDEIKVGLKGYCGAAYCIGLDVVKINENKMKSNKI